MKGKEFNLTYIRKLGWNDKQRFYNSVKKLHLKLIEALKNKMDGDEIWDTNIKTADVYLIKKSMCESDGTLIWSDEKELSEFLDLAGPDVVEEIIYNINEFSGIDKNYEPGVSEDEDSKKNNDSLEETL